MEDFIAWGIGALFSMMAIGIALLAYFCVSEEINMRIWCRVHTDLPYSVCESQMHNIRNFGIKDGTVTVDDALMGHKK